jgi:hypothetical protein
MHVEAMLKRVQVAAYMLRASITEKGWRMRDVANRLLQFPDAPFAYAPSQPVLHLQRTYAHPVRKPFVRTRLLKEG